MFADTLRVQFVEDVILPLCEKYGKDTREGWQVFQAAYETHRAQHGSLALVPDREARMQERVGVMMLAFFQWLYGESETPAEIRGQQAGASAGEDLSPLESTQSEDGSRPAGDAASVARHYTRTPRQRARD